MRITSKLYKQIIKEEIQKHISNNIWYHGSPVCCFDENNFNKKFMFLTKDKNVAKQYATNQRFDKTVEIEEPTIYKINVLTNKILNVNIPEHEKLYLDNIKTIRQKFKDDPDNWLSKNDIEFSKDGKGLNFSSIYQIYDNFHDKFDGVILSEASQGLSLGLFDPIGKYRILDTQRVPI